MSYADSQMKSCVVVAGVLLGMVAASPAFAAKKNFKATIEGNAVGSPGTGTGKFTFDDVTKRLCGTAEYTGLTGGDVTVAALKEGNAFTIVKPLTASASPLKVDVTLSDEQVPLLETGPIYIAIGNAMHGVAAGETQNGEVNGELVADPAGAEQACGGGEAPPDAGDGTPQPDSGAGPSPGGNSGGLSDAGTSADGGAPTAPADTGGCSTSGSSTGPFALIAMAVALVTLKRRQLA